MIVINVSLYSLTFVRLILIKKEKKRTNVLEKNASHIQGVQREAL